MRSTRRWSIRPTTFCGPPPASWIWGRAGCEIVVAPGISAVQAHQLTVSAEHALLHAIPRLSGALVHADPQVPGTDPHDVLADHPAGPGPVLTVTVTRGDRGMSGWN